jgi:hypothetical protein
MMSIRTVKRIALSLLAALLFAQGALAAAGCDRLQRAPAEAIAVAGEETPPCHQSQRSMDNLCVLHCLGEFQSLDKPSAKLPALGDAPVLVVLVPAPRWALRVYAPDAPARVSAPPPRILFSKLLI